MMNVCIYFATSLQDFGVSSFQVQLKSVTAKDQTLLLGLNLLQALFVASLLYLSTPLIVDFYQMPALQSLLLWCCVLIGMNGWSMVHQSSLIKQLRLVTLAKLELFCKMAGIALTWYLVIRQPDNLNAIVLGYLCSAMLKAFLFWTLKSTHVRFERPTDVSLVRQAFRYGCWQLGSQQLSLLRAQSDQLIVGKLLGMEVLGIYSLAREIMQYPARFTQPVLQRLLLPRFVQRGESDQTLLYQSLTYSLWFHDAVYSALALSAGFLVQWLFSAQYSQIAILLCLLSLGAVVRPNGQILVPFIQANGQVRRELLWNLVTTLVWCMSLFLLMAYVEFLTAVLLMSLLQILVSFSAFWYLTTNNFVTAIQVFSKMSYRPLTLTLVLSGVGLLIQSL